MSSKKSDVISYGGLAVKCPTSRSQAPLSPPRPNSNSSKSLLQLQPTSML